MSAPRKLVLADGLSLPAELAATQTFGILAKRGAGKSNAAAVMAEEMFAAGVPFVVVDPVGAWWGLRSSGDGKSQGLPVPILGGHHGDVPLERGGAELVADLIVDESLSCVLDVSTLESEAAKRAFLAAFAERLFRQKGRPGKDSPLHLFLEEADDYAPQRAMKDAARCLGAFQRIVKQGRARGLGATMITQRSAVLNKDLLTQIETLIVLRTTSPQDRKAIADWIVYHGQAREMLESLHQLAKGEAWVWSPWLELVKRVQIRRRRTFDSGATPTLAAARRTPATLADIDLGALRSRMQQAVERARDEDPKELRKRIAELERERRKGGTGEELAAVARARADLEEALGQARDRIHELEAYTASLTGRMQEGRGLADRLGELLRNGDGPPAADAGLEASVPLPRRAVAAPIPRGMPVDRARPPAARTAAPRARGENLPRGEAAVLTAACQYPAGVDRQQISILTGYKRSSRDAYVQRLKDRGLVEVRGNLVLAAAGAEDHLGEFAPLPTGAALQRYWLDRLPAGERAVLQALIDHHPHGLLRDAISALTTYKRSSRDAYIQRLNARKVIEVDGIVVRASGMLF